MDGSLTQRGKLFIDTGALLALAIRKDQHHREAVRYLKSVPHARFVLTNLVLAEVAARLRARAGAAVAAAHVRNLLESRRYEVVFVDRPLVDAAAGKMEQFRDQPLSFTDCVSFALMDALGLTSAFAFDTDFRNCGYRMVP